MSLAFVSESDTHKTYEALFGNYLVHFKISKDIENRNDPKILEKMNGLWRDLQADGKSGTILINSPEDITVI